MKKPPVHRLSSFKLKYELFPSKRGSLQRDQLRGFWWGEIKRIPGYFRSLKRWIDKPRSITIRKTKITLLSFGALVIWGQLHPSKIIYGDPIAPVPSINKVNTKPLKPIEQTKAQEIATVAPVYVAPPPPPAVIPNCGDNFYKQFIYSHESGCRTNAHNPGGCRGLGQACPGSKLPCSDYDWACQDAFFSNYAINTYGSWAGAYSAWISKGWW